MRNYEGTGTSRGSYTDQTAFDTVAFHLLAQGRKSLLGPQAGAYRCAYRGEGGTSCAIGCLIPDEEYRSEFEGRSIWQFRLPSLVAVNVRLLTDLQYIHDWRHPSNWSTVLRRCAEIHGLDTRILDIGGGHGHG